MANQAQLKKALQRPYDLNLFAKEVLNPVFGSNFQMNSNPVPATIELNQTESKVINKVLIYGKMELEDLTEVICYEIHLHPNSKIEYSKVAIQRYVRKLLGNGQAALINFVNPVNKNVWRFTYIANERKIDERGQRVSKLVNAKRYTYLLGTYESCKTAAERFEILSAETSLTMETLTKAFSVEKLSKSFFDEYLQHYNNFVNYITKSNFKTSVFAGDEKAIRDFSKKLLGRIVFLYFVQKKGWLGATDLEYKDGLQNFISEFYKLAGANDAFYNNHLKILFFETLNKARKDDDFTMPDGNVRKIPFLNGGLFDREKVDENILTFKPELFHSIWDEENPKTRGFLDFLNAYNFTVYEDSPDEQTVAVDPEMLGHIFENLLEDNKDKGAYYTPKEIVHYMCQESLSEYLKTNMDKNLTGFQNLLGLENLVKQKEISTLTTPELQEIDKLLVSVKICDPAIGSGAFPVGLLQEIFAIKEVIAYETGIDWKPAQVKENIIQNSIYGVDIEKGAVDIARLRFWLSLVVDEEKPKALPNLDYKIVVGNSLVSKFEDEIIEIDWSTDTTKAGVFAQDIAKKRIDLLTELTKKQRLFFHSENLDKKKCALEIRNLKIDILANQLELMIKTKGLETQPTYGSKMKEQTELYLKTVGWKKMLANLENLKNQADKLLNYFDWQLDFPEILNSNLVKNNAGFDIVIGNPPYIGQKGHKEQFEQFKVSEFWCNFYERKQDFYYYFIVQGINLCNNEGLLTYINPPYYFTAEGAKNLRNYIVKNASINKICNLSDNIVFDNVSINSIINFFSKSKNNKLKIKIYEPNKNSKVVNMNELTYSLSKYSTNELTASEWHIFKDNSTVEVTTIERVQLSAIATISPGIQTGADKVSKSHISEFPNHYYIKDTGIYVLSNSEYKNINFSEYEKQFIKPFFKNSQIHKWCYDYENDYWLIITNNIVDINLCPNIKTHLVKFKPILDNRYRNFALINADKEGKWWFLYGYRPNTNFENEKIILPYRSITNTFAYSCSSFYASIDVFFINITNNNFSTKFVLAVLCSKFIGYWLDKNCKRKGKILELYQKPLSNIPIPKISKFDQVPFIKLADEILAKKKVGENTDHFERQIDEMVYKLYELTPEEIKIVEGKNE